MVWKTQVCTTKPPPPTQPCRKRVIGLVVERLRRRTKPLPSLWSSRIALSDNKNRIISKGFSRFATRQVYNGLVLLDFSKLWSLHSKGKGNVVRARGMLVSALLFFYFFFCCAPYAVHTSSHDPSVFTALRNRPAHFSFQTFIHPLNYTQHLKTI